MHTVIAAEALFFVLAFAKGAGIMLGYDILRAFRRGFPHGGRLVAAEDFFYWVFAWIFVFGCSVIGIMGRSGGMCWRH